MWCCSQRPSASSDTTRPRAHTVERQTQFILDEHSVELERIGRLSSPAFARRTPPFLIEGPGGGATRHEKKFLLEGLLAELEHGGWFLKAAVEALWAGERDLAKLQAVAAEDGLCSPQLVFVLEAILKAVPHADAGPAQPPPGASSPQMSPRSLQRRASSRRMAVSSPSPSPSEKHTVEALMDDAISLGEAVAADGDNHAVAPKREKQPHEIANINISIGRNAMLSGLDSDARASLTSCMRERKFAEGEEIVVQGQVRKRLYYGVVFSYSYLKKDDLPRQALDAHPKS